MASRRILSVAVIVLVAAAFTVAALTQGTGWLFLISIGLAAGMLIVVVFLVAFSGGRTPVRHRLDGDFGMFDRITAVGARGRLSDPEGGNSPDGLSYDRAVKEGTGGSARSFVNALVPLPKFPSTLLAGASRRELLNALRREGTGLIRLAKITGVDVTPYQVFLADARKAAVRGDAQATIRSLQLANELLRAAIEKGFIKRRRSEQRTRDFDEL